MTKKNTHTFLMQYAINESLIEDRNRMKSVTIESLFENNSSRFDKYSLEAAGLFLDYSKNLVDDDTLNDLLTLAKEADIPNAVDRMFHGEKINVTENRAVLHTALRCYDEPELFPQDKHLLSEVSNTWSRIEELTKHVHSGLWKGWTGKKIRHVVNIGIGGSYLGARTVLDALAPYHNSQITPHFITNIDPSSGALVFAELDPETTLFIVASKSFGTLETLENALVARKWMREQGMPEKAVSRHFIAVSSNIEKAMDFGIAHENIFPVQDGVGGRYSLWSAIGLIIPLVIGFESFANLAKGARKMDKHFKNAPISENMPIILGLLGVWYHNYFGAETYAILPYDNLMKTFTDHLQQLDMESNGKSVTLSGEKVTTHTGPVIWGNVGTDGQHAYHQLLHQGTRFIPVDFIVPLSSHYSSGKQHEWLVANAFAQSQTLMKGYSLQQAESDLQALGKSPEEAKALAPHKVIPGNRPGNTITMEKLTPETMGALLALYEHKVFVQGCLWSINSFDQWGVELGKIAGKTIFEQITGNQSCENEDASTRGLIARFQKVINKSSG